jgi:hypothetical protein
MKIQILDKSKKKKLIKELGDLGLKKIPQTLVKAGKEKVRAYSGNLTTEQIMELWRLLPIEGIGLYSIKDVIDKSGRRETRFTVDGMHLWQDQLTNNIIQLTQGQEEEWFKTSEVQLNEEQIKNIKDELVSVKSFDGLDFIGPGKISIEKKMLYGFLPKERRRKSQTI